jgi:BirA family transcriptional regulator, biotin operon repressor / biotin---[acetyl-CoA-carboxylase] ligase
MEVHKIYFQTLESTNAWAFAHAHELDPKNLTCIHTRMQTAGYGRQKRPWISKEGNLTFSLFFSLQVDDPRIPNLAQIAAFSILKVLEKKGIAISIKWPNDLQFDQKKLAGVLVETLPLQLGIVIGIGMNVNSPISVDQETTSLFEITKKTWDLEPFLEEILESFLSQLDQGFSKRLYEPYLSYKGEKIKLHILEKMFIGTLEGLTEEGHLKLILQNGENAEFSSGDIEHLRRI